MARILIITESRSALRTFRASLAGHDIQTVTSRVAATGEGIRHHPDLIIVDLPDDGGVQLVRDLHRPPAAPVMSGAPVVVTSSLRDHGAIATILDTGADDHITKPFDRAEFAARIRALLRRARSHRSQPSAGAPMDRTGMVRTAAFTIDLAGKQVIRAGRPVALTPTEWRILEVLARPPAPSSRPSNSSMRPGGPATRPRPRTCASICTSSAPSSNPTPRTPVI